MGTCRSAARSLKLFSCSNAFCEVACGYALPFCCTFLWDCACVVERRVQLDVMVDLPCVMLSACFMGLLCHLRLHVRLGVVSAKCSHTERVKIVVAAGIVVAACFCSFGGY